MTTTSRPSGRISISTRPDGKLTIKGLKVWSAIKGVKGYGSPAEGDNFDTSDLDEMVRAQKEIGHQLQPRLYPAHPVNPLLKMLARPQGQIVDLRREGDFLLADLDGVDPAFWKRASDDSARFSPDVKMGHTDRATGKTYPMSIVGLGVLGAVQPANDLLPSASDYAVHYYAEPDPVTVRAYSEGDVRSYTGAALPKPDVPTSPLSRAAEHLRAYTAQPEAPQPVSPERQPGFSQVLISRKES